MVKTNNKKKARLAKVGGFLVILSFIMMIGTGYVNSVSNKQLELSPGYPTPISVGPSFMLLAAAIAMIILGIVGIIFIIVGLSEKRY